MKRVPWKYLAGLIDGEGCVDVQVTKVNENFYVRPRLRIALVSSCRPLLGMLKNSHGGVLCERKSKNPNWQDSVSWELAGYSKTCAVFRNLVNSLFIKREQVRFCLWLEQNVKGKQVGQTVRDAIREELKLMKRDPHRLSEKAQEKILGML